VKVLGQDHPASAKRPLDPKQRGEVVDGSADRWVVGAERLLIDCERALHQLLGLGDSGTGPVYRPLPSLRVEKLIPPSIGASFSSGRRCVASENVVSVFCSRVAGEALCVQRLVTRFALCEVGESPAAGRGVFF
jgi:hypothetical protein